jgi:transcriptional repressor NrdR
MDCPRCVQEHKSSIGTTVRETRDDPDTDVSPRVRRRRECASCGLRFTTYETVESGAVLGAGGRRVRFSRERLLHSLEVLGEDAPNTAELEQLVEEIQRRVESHVGAIATDTLVAWVAAELPTPQAREKYLEAVRRLDRQEAARIAWGRVRKQSTGDEQWFDRRKLRDSIGKAAHRLVSPNQLDGVVDAIERRVVKQEGPEQGKAVDTAQIRQWVEDELVQLNELACVRYAAAGPGANLGHILQHVTHVSGGHVKKKDDRLEPFDSRKLESSVKLAFGKRQPDASFWKEFNVFANDLANEVAVSKEPISTGEIGRRLLVWLKGKDEIAFLNYLIPYRGLKPHELMDELRKWEIELPKESEASSSRTAKKRRSK